MIRLARSDERVIVDPGELDAGPMLFACRNGVVDLRTGELRAPRREDLITRQAPVSYDPTATSEEWNQFLSDLTDGDEDLQAFLRRAVGYSLTGDTREEKLFLSIGEGATGKSTWVETLRTHLGGQTDGYAITASFDAFLSKRNEGVRNDLARLAGSRLVIASEVDDGEVMAQGVVKSLTGGDTITARFLYAEFFEYRPTFKIWLVANHRPRIPADDGAMWRRIMVIPFDHVVPPARRDPGLKHRLADPELTGPAVLAWAVRGCLEWQRDGLGSCAAVEEATERYRVDMDPFHGFIGGPVVIDRDSWESTRALLHAYERWLFWAATPEEDWKAVARQLRLAGAERCRRKGEHGWKGVRIVHDRYWREDQSDDEPDEEPDPRPPIPPGRPWTEQFHRSD